MTRRFGRHGIVPCALIGLLLLAGTLAAAQEDASTVREALARLGQSSPLVFAALADDGEAGAELAEAWDALPAERRDMLAERLAGIDGWERAPDALAAALDPALATTLRARGAEAAAFEQSRERLELALATLSLLPDEEIDAGGLDVPSLRSALARLAAGGSVAVDPAAAEKIYDATFGALAAPVQDALRGMLQKGPPEAGALEAFRGRMLRLLSSLERLGAARTGVSPPDARRLRWQLEVASHPALALLAAQTDEASLARIERAAELWNGEAALADAERARLETVRSTVAWMLATIPESESRHALEQRLATADAGELLLIEGRLAEIADPAALARLHEAVSGSPGNDVVDAAGSFGTDATDRMERSGDAGSAPGTIHTMGVVVEIGPGNPSFPSPPLPDGCGITDPVGCIESLVSRAAGAVSSLFNSIGAPVRDWAASVRDFSLGVYQTVSSTMQALPGQVKDGIVNVTRQLLDPIQEQFTPERIAETLELAEGFWNDLPEAPEIPCPAIGEQIPFFGTVGDGDAAQKYANYLWVFEQVLDIIPDTEVSLAVEIPAKVAYGGVQYLGLCLEQAAAAVESEQTESYRAGVNDDLAGEGERIDAAGVAIDGSRAQTAQISAQVASWVAQSTSLITQLNVEKTLVRSGRGSVSHFQLPERLGGQLETVRDLVGATIDAVIQAGLETNDAEQSLESGDLLYERGEYRLAFAAWREAYRRAASEVSIGDHRLPDPAGKGGGR